MEGGCRTPSELRKIDDGGVFDRLLRDAEEKSNGDDTRCEQILSRRIVAKFVKRIKAETGPSREGPSAKGGPPKPRTLPPRPLLLVSDHPSVPLKKRIRLDDETTSDRSPHLPRATINPSSSSRDRIKPKLQKKEERKKAIQYSLEQVKQLKQMGMSLPLPEEVRVRLQELGGSTNPVRLVIKHLFQTDLREHNGRLNLPETKFVKTDEGGGFLTEEEWRALKNKETMKVRLVGPMCTEPTSMVLKTWEMQAGSVPILTSGWAKFLKKYETEHKGMLREGDGVQLWATRCDGNDLLLALQVIHRGPVVVVDDDIE